jgi:hypothetical protein
MANSFHFTAYTFPLLTRYVLDAVRLTLYAQLSTLV